MITAENDSILKAVTHNSQAIIVIVAPNVPKKMVGIGAIDMMNGHKKKTTKLMKL